MRASRVFTESGCAGRPEPDQSPKVATANWSAASQAPAGVAWEHRPNVIAIEE